jgi:hypothetical protein
MEGHILLDPLFIDSGELGRMTPELAFTLGVEWATLRLIVDMDPNGQIDMDLHSENVERIITLCNSRGRAVADVAKIDNVWSSLSVMPTASNVLRLVR